MKRWLVRIGIALGILGLLIVAFYVEENWRGARLWAQTKAEYEAKGFSFDPKTLIPPPIPDEQNFAASEIWKHLEQYKKTDGKENFQVALFTAGAIAQKVNSKGNNWLLGIKTSAPDPVLFSGTEAEIADLYAAMERPRTRFTLDYGHVPAYGMPLPQANTLLHLAKALRWHALIALEHSQPDIAAKDVSACLRLGSAGAETPVIVLGLVGASIEAMTQSIIWQGIESHSWSDENLAQFQTQLAQTNFLTAFEKDIRSELFLNLLPTLNWMQRSPKKVKDFAATSNKPDASEIQAYQIIPIGLNAWIFNSSHAYDKTRYEAFHFHLDQIIPVVNVSDHRFFAQRIPDFEEFSHRRRYNYPSLILGLSTSGLSGAPVLFGQAQARIDLAQVACGLERYWLVNKKYPATLAELEPKFIAHVPHDLCSGEPLHYRVEADGNYTLYSVGFNGVDDGGKIVMKKDSDGKESKTVIDPKQGDWVWPRLKE